MENSWCFDSGDDESLCYTYLTKNTYTYNSSGNLTNWTQVNKTNEEIQHESFGEVRYDTFKSPLYHCKTPKWYLLYMFGGTHNTLGLYNNAVEELSVAYGTKRTEYEYDSDGFPTKATSVTVYEHSEEKYTNVIRFTYSK